DALRTRIEALGFTVTDTPQGSRVEVLTAVPLPRIRAADVQATSERTNDISVTWVAEGWPEDVLRGIESFRRFGEAKQQHVVVDDVPAKRHEHRRWTSTPVEKRDRLSKRNFKRFLDRFRGRFDLCVAAQAPDA